MEVLIVALLFILNVGISFWNAYSCGSYWTESKIAGGWTRVITWCGLIMAACGFTWTYMMIFAVLGVGAKVLTPEWGEVMLKIGYLILIFPILGSGLGIWIHSLVYAFRRRSFGSVAVAGWNTSAQLYNTWQAARTVPGFVDDVIGAFTPKKGRGKDAGGILVLIIVVLALSAGTITTIAIARWADRKVQVEVAEPERRAMRARP